MTRRLLSAAMLLPLFLAVPYWGIWPSALLTAVCIVICLWEAYNELRKSGYHPLALRGYIAGVLFCVAAALHNATPADLTGAALLASIAGIFAPGWQQARHEVRLLDYVLTFALACYIGWLLSHYVLMLHLETPLQPGLLSFLNIPAGAAWVYLAFGINWTSDTAAFLVGRTWGRRKIAPVISPKKTLEGFLGGLVGAVCISPLLCWLLGLPVAPLVAVLLGLVGALAGTFGDLVVSLFKREAGIKDMSNLVPGHGGLLDRADGLLFSAPVLYYLFLLLCTG